MNCAEFESILADYLDGTLPEAERAAVADHAAGCAVCREFVEEVQSGLTLVERAAEVVPPPELVTRIAFHAPVGRSREPFERQGFFSRLAGKWVMPVLQPKLAMGMAMTVLSFAMLERCTGVQTQRIQSAELSPVRVWSGVEDRAMRARDRVVKYYENLRVVYEIEARLRDLQQEQESSERANASRRTTSVNPIHSGTAPASSAKPSGQRSKP